MNIRSKLRLLGVGSNPASQAEREAEIHQVQHDVDVLKLRENARLDLALREADVQAQVDRQRSEAKASHRQRMGDAWRHEWDSWATTVGLAPLLTLAIVLVGGGLAALGAYPLYGVYDGPAVLGYSLQEGTVRNETMLWGVVYRPKGDSSSTFQVYIPATSSQEAVVKFEELSTLYPDLEFRLEKTGTKARCWEVVEQVRYSEDPVVSPCYSDYAAAVAVLSGFKNGTIDQVPSTVLSDTTTYKPSIGPASVPSATGPTRVVTQVVFLPEAMMDEVDALYPGAVDYEGPDYLWEIAPTGDYVAITE